MRLPETVVNVFRPAPESSTLQAENLLVPDSEMQVNRVRTARVDNCVDFVIILRTRLSAFYFRKNIVGGDTRLTNRHMCEFRTGKCHDVADGVYFFVTLHTHRAAHLDEIGIVR